MGEAKRRKNLDPNYGNCSKSRYDSYFKQGVKFEQQKEYKKAIYFYSQAIECDPSNSEAYFARGNVYDDLENYLNAINDYSEYIKLSGGSFKGFNNRALIYVKLEQDENAIPDLEQAIKLDPSRPCPYQQLGALVWNQGKLTRSIELCRKAAQLYQKENNREGYQACLEMIDAGEAHRGLIQMALNDPYVDEIDWGKFHSKPESLSSAIKTQKKTEIHDLSFPITPRKGYKLNQKLRMEGLGWFYKEFMTQNNMLESQCYVTEVIPDIHPRIEPQKFSVDGEDFSLPVVCFHPESNIIKVLGLKESEVVLVSRFHYFEQIQQKALKPQFFGCVKIVENIAQHYGYVARQAWDSIDYSDEKENSLIVNPLRNSNDDQEEKVKTIIEREELGISVDRTLIKVNISYLDEHEEQEWQEVFVYLLDNAEPYEDRIIALINEKFGDNWSTMNWTES